MKGKTVKAVVLIAATAILVAEWLVVFDPRIYAWQQKRMVKRVLASDPGRLLSAGRQLYANRSGHVGDIDISSHDIPPCIQQLKPSRLSFETNSLRVEFGDVFNPFGLIVFPEGVEGHGTYKWIDGLWLYDDGQVELYGRPSEPGSNLVVSIRSVPQPQANVSVRDISHWRLRIIARKWLMVSESGEEKPVSMGGPANRPLTSPVVTEHASGVFLGSPDLLPAFTRQFHPPPFPSRRP